MHRVELLPVGVEPNKFMFLVERFHPAHYIAMLRVQFSIDAVEAHHKFDLANLMLDALDCRLGGSHHAF